MSEEKISLIDQFYYAMFKPRFYNKLSKLKVSSVIIYTFILLLFTTLIRAGMPIGAWISSQGGLNTVIMDKIPAFYIENNEFFIEKPFNVEIGGVSIKADSHIEKYTIDDLDEEEKYMALCFGKSSLLVVSGGMGMEMKWSDLQMNEFNNQALADLIPVIYIYIGVGLLFTLIFAAARYVIVALIFALIGNNFSKFLKADLGYWKVFELALYAQTLGYVVSAITAVVGGMGINLIMSFVSVLATAFILNGGILSHKADINVQL